METRKETVKTSSCNKSNLVVRRTSTKISIIDTSYELYPKRYISKVGFEGNCQKKSMKIVSGSSSNKGKLLDDMDMLEVEPSVGFYPEHLNEDEISIPHPDVPNGNHNLPDSTRYEVGDTSNGPSPLQSRSIRDHLSSIIDNPEIEPSYKRLMECLSKDENAFTYGVPSGDHALMPSSEILNGHDLVCTTDERGRVLYIEPSDIKACKNNNQEAPLLSSGGSSMFDEKLNVILSRPYDKNEYEELWRKATRRKVYVSGKVSQPYLDYHPDLAVQIESASRDDERLSLLRTFFFWLQNLCHEGAYKPWREAWMSKTVDEYESGQALAQDAP